jgi:NADH dehydrogenase [ubiquinone] 1 alpha subcomplex assembly factor 1
MDGFLRFKGVLSLENNGGFSSIYREADLDLSDFSGVELKVKGDGRVYDFRFRTSARLVGNWYVSYSGKIKTEKNKWITVKVPFDELKQSFRGRQLSGFAFQKDQIQQVRILLGD